MRKVKRIAITDATVFRPQTDYGTTALTAAKKSSFLLYYLAKITTNASFMVGVSRLIFTHLLPGCEGRDVSCVEGAPGFRSCRCDPGFKPIGQSEYLVSNEPFGGCEGTE